MQLKSKEERDAIIASGMEDGLQDALGLLEQVAISLDRENLARPVGPDQVLARARSARPTRPKIP